MLARLSLDPRLQAHRRASVGEAHRCPIWVQGRTSTAAHAVTTFARATLRPVKRMLGSGLSEVAVTKDRVHGGDYLTQRNQSRCTIPVHPGAIWQNVKTATPTFLCFTILKF